MQCVGFADECWRLLPAACAVSLLTGDIAAAMDVVARLANITANASSADRAEMAAVLHSLEASVAWARGSPAEALAAASRGVKASPHQSSAWCDGVALLVVSPPQAHHGVGAVVPPTGAHTPCTAMAMAASALLGSGSEPPIALRALGLLALSLVAEGEGDTPSTTSAAGVDHGGDVGGGGGGNASVGAAVAAPAPGADNESGGDGSEDVADAEADANRRVTVSTRVDAAVAAASKAVREDPSSAEAWAVLSAALHGHAVREGALAAALPLMFSRHTHTHTHSHSHTHMTSFAIPPRPRPPSRVCKFACIRLFVCFVCHTCSVLL
jgi:hypothetical protein